MKGFWCFSNPTILDENVEKPKSLLSVLKMTSQAIVPLCNHIFSLNKPRAKCSIRNPIPKAHSNKCALQAWCCWFSGINYLAAHCLHSIVWFLLGDNTYCSHTIYSVNRNKIPQGNWGSDNTLLLVIWLNWLVPTVSDLIQFIIIPFLIQSSSHRQPTMTMQKPVV